MALTAVDNGGSIGWSCSSSDISDYLPSSCAEVTSTPIEAASSASAPVDAGPVAWVKGTKDKDACYCGLTCTKGDAGSTGWMVGASGCPEWEAAACGDRAREYADDPSESSWIFSTIHGKTYKCLP
jgi:hypothetical protein